MVEPTRIATSPSASRIGAWPNIDGELGIDEVVEVLAAPGQDRLRQRVLRRCWHGDNLGGSGGPRD